MSTLFPPRRASRGTFLLLASAVGITNACAETGAAPPPRSVTVTRVGESTLVSVDENARQPENPECVAFCRRLEECRFAVPGVDLVLPRDEFIARCRAEHEDCRTPTTETLCCSRVSSCTDFGQCHARSRDVVQVCERH